MMDRNENQNSYQHMISTRGNGRELNALKRRINVLTAVVVLLAAAVIALGIFVAGIYIKERSGTPDNTTGGTTILRPSAEEAPEKIVSTEMVTDEAVMTEQLSETEKTAETQVKTADIFVGLGKDMSAGDKDNGEDNPDDSGDRP